MVLHGRSQKGSGLSKDEVQYTLASNGISTPKPQSKEVKEAKAIAGTVAIFIVAGTTAGALGWFFYNLDTPRSILMLDGLHIQLTNYRYVEFLDSDKQVLMKGNLGTTFREHFVTYEFKPKGDYYVRMALVNHVEMAVTLKLLTRDIRAYHINWTAKSCMHKALQDCFYLDNHWYGMGTIYNQKWPLELVTLPETPLTSGVHLNGSLGGIQDRYWLLSSGVAIQVDWDIPLWININSTVPHNMCLKAAYHSDIYPHYNFSVPLSLRYTIYIGPDAKTLHSYMTNNIFHRPGLLPGYHLFNHPSWSVIVNEAPGKDTSIIKYTQDIVNHDFGGALLILRFHKSNVSQNKDDSNSFKVQHFEMDIGEVKRLGFCPVMTVSPLALLPSYSSRMGITDAFLTVDNIYRVAAKWYQKTLKHYKERGICSCAVYMLQNPTKSTFQNFKLPPSVSKLLLLKTLSNVTAAVFKDSVFTTASDMRHISNFVQMKARLDRWDSHGGLNSIIPEALTLGLIGYPYVMAPGMGIWHSTNTYSAQQAQHINLPERRLYLRWLSVVALFPSIHFTTPPWYYDSNVTEIAKMYMALHSKYVPKMLHYAEVAIKTGTPILRPLWWADPQDTTAQTINDQFLLGDEVLVAPVMDPQTDMRDIYIPSGEWWDNLRQARVIGGGWLLAYKASLSELPHFNKIQTSNPDVT